MKNMFATHCFAIINYSEEKKSFDTQVAIRMSLISLLAIMCETSLIEMRAEERHKNNKC